MIIDVFFKAEIVINAYIYICDNTTNVKNMHPHRDSNPDVYCKCMLAMFAIKCLDPIVNVYLGTKMCFIY